MPSVAQIDGLNIPGGAPAISAPAAAYSVRLLDTAVGVPTYTGAAMRVRRDTGGGTGDDDEADIAFDSGIISLDSAISNASAGVTATTLGQFINVGEVNSIVYSNPDSLTVTASCFVDTWMDQSGNSNDAIQNSHGQQPQIHDGTADTDLIQENGKPALKANAGGNNLGLVTSVNVDYQQEAWFFGVLKITGNSIPVATTSNAYFALSQNGGTGGTTSGFTNVTYYSDGTVLSSPTSGDLYDELTTQSLLTVDHEWSSTNETPTYEVGGYGFFSRNIFQEYILYQTSQTSNRTDIETNINAEYLIYQPTDQPTSGLLYDYGSATGGTDAAAAYSVRQLSDKAVLCMRIRRDMGAGNPGDDDETNIGFDANGDLDTQAISDFCGTGTGFVTRWWDQSVNGNHADQPVGGTGSNGDQPQIYNGTAVITKQGEPCVYFGVSASANLSAGNIWTDASGPVSGFAVLNIDTTQTGNFLGRWIHMDTQAFHYVDSEFRFLDSALVSVSTPSPAIDTDFLATFFHKVNQIQGQDAIQGAINGGTFVGNKPASRTFNELRLGGGQYNLDANLKEVVVWNTGQNANRTGIEDNINDHFDIYT